MSLIIRADGNAKTGAGHLMRCLTIAEACRRRNTEVRFLCGDDASADLARSHGFPAEVLSGGFAEPDRELEDWRRGFPLDDREINAKTQAAGVQADASARHRTILVDSYEATDVYLQALRAFGRVFLMDDMQNHAFPVDGVINYNVFADEKRYRTLYYDRNVIFALGARYIPLRQQFWNREYEVKPEARRILITAGGGDADNIAGQIAAKLLDTELELHIVAGHFNPHDAELRRMAQEHPQIQIHRDVQDMASLMLSCDLAVTAGGSTVYELAALGVPFVCFSYAENQELLTEYIGRESVAGYAGAWHKDAAQTLENIAWRTAELAADAGQRKRFAKRERTLVDGHGADRLAELLCGGLSTGMEQ